ncbi:hypothetical protein ABPG75_006307 [Micractinium tetrahymenae]
MLTAGRLTGSALCTGSHPRPLRGQQRRRQRAAAAAADGPAPDKQASQPPPPQQRPEFDIVSGSRLPEAQGPTCDWPRLEQRRRWDVRDSPLVTTGFPVPAGYGSSPATLPPAGGGMLWRLRNPERQPAGGAFGAGGGGMGGSFGQQVVPVFRSAPYPAEAARQRRPSPTARILFLDEGCSCRAVLAAALLQAMLRKHSTPLDAEVTAASIGPPAPGAHDERVAAVAREMDIELPPRRAREFDEMRDTPAYDLILVLDRYDEQEVVREVSVLERLNPGGAYLTRVHRLNEFARAGQLVFKDRCLLVPEDVPDPFYGLVSAAAELASLRSTVHSIVLGCRGLMAYLLKLRSKCGSGAAAVPLRVALAQSLQCPLLDPTSHHALSALIHCQLHAGQVEGQQQVQQAQRAQREGRSQAGGDVAVQPGQSAGWAAHIRSWPRPVWLGSCSDSDGDSEEGDYSGPQRSLWTVRDVAGQRVVVRRARPSERAAPHGYWTKVENVELELSKWMEQHGRQGRLPTQRELRRSGANTLSAKVDSHGGLAVFAERMGLPLASGRAPNGQWDDFEKLAEELRRFVAQRQHARKQQQAGSRQEAQVQAWVQPTAEQQQLAQAQHQLQQQRQLASPGQQQAQALRPQPRQAEPALAPLVSANLSSSGGGGGSIATGTAGGSLTGSSARMSSTASAMGSGQCNLRFASRSWSRAGLGTALSPALGPPAITLLAADGSVADSTAGACAASEPSGGSSSSSSSGEELVFLPTQQELRGAGRTDLIGAIRANGGSLAVARRLGWVVHHGRLPSEAVVVQQLLEFAEQAGREAGGRPAGRRAAVPLPMPTLRQLEGGGRADLASAVQRLGGCGAFAALLAAEQRRRQRRRHRHAPSPGGGEERAVQPPQLQLSQILRYAPGSPQGPGALGGGSRGARRPEAPAPPQPAVVRVGEAVVQLIEARGWERRVPTKQELLAAGRRDLLVAIARCGGSQKLAEHLQLPYAEMRGRRKRGEQAGAGNGAGSSAGQANADTQAGGASAQQPELQPDFLAARLRQPPGLAMAAAGAAQRSSAGASGKASAGGKPRGPASALLERELIVDAYNDLTFV